MLCSSCLVWMSLPKHNCYLSYKGAARSSCPSWPSFITVVIQAHASWKLSCMKILHRNVLHVVHGYCTKLQRQDYTEQCKPDNNNVYIYIIWKITCMELYLTSSLPHFTYSYFHTCAIMLEGKWLTHIQNLYFETNLLVCFKVWSMHLASTSNYTES